MGAGGRAPREMAAHRPTPAALQSAAASNADQTGVAGIAELVRPAKRAMWGPASPVAAVRCAVRTVALPDSRVWVVSAAIPPTCVAELVAHSGSPASEVRAAPIAQSVAVPAAEPDSPASRVRAVPQRLRAATCAAPRVRRAQVARASPKFAPILGLEDAPTPGTSIAELPAVLRVIPTIAHRTIRATRQPPKRLPLAGQLAWVASRRALDASTPRAHVRAAPRWLCAVRVARRAPRAHRD
jgi:hypothetical protein